MFTGIVQAVGSVVSIVPSVTGSRLLIDVGAWGHRPSPGDSVAVSGCCLTCAPAGDTTATRWGFDVVHQTLERTTLGRLAPGARVNLEASLTLATPLGGHLVQGHVDGVARITDIDTSGGGHRVSFRVEGGAIRYIIPTGSIAVEGVSLTVAEVSAQDHSFTVALIPTTLKDTTLGGLRVGGEVNIETDLLARTAIHHLELIRGRKSFSQ